ncbi:hypothetical protein JCM8097_000734 [Rhodosporidiobolus ruineniae]
MSTATASRVPPTASTASVVRPQADARLRLVNVLVLTALLGTTWSVISTSSATTAFRSRLPAHTLTRLTNTATAFPVPSLPFFADKRNILNQLFVKNSWGWVTGIFLVLSLALFLFHPHHPSHSASPPPSKSPSAQGPTPTSRHLLSTLRRYLLASLFWFYLTQATWFGTRVGPSIAFRILRASGATCVPSAISSDPLKTGAGGGLHADGPNEPGAATVPVCTGARGEYWRGGHDVSGHAFMMVHASLFLFEALYPLLPSLFPRLFAPSSSTTGRPEPRKPMHPVVALVGYVGVAVIGLCWWMLLTTSLFFHTPAEKLTGVAFGVVGWYLSSL